MKKLAGILIVLLLLTACSNEVTNSTSDTAAISGHDMAQSKETAIEPESLTDAIQIRTFHGEDLYDYENKKEAVGAHHYVFAGEVVEILGAEYPFRYTYAFENGEVMTVDGNIYTHLRVKITENIKGNQPVGTTKDILKPGGYDAADDTYYLCELDTYPQVGAEYVFLAEENGEGILIVAAPQSTIPLSGTDGSIASYSAEPPASRQAVIDEYMEAYRNEIPLSE